MPRYTVEDKKMIAKAKGQEVWGEGDFGGRIFKGYRCKRCRKIFPLRNLEVDHIRPLAKGGRITPANLQLLCSACNRQKGARVQKKAKPKRKGT